MRHRRRHPGRPSSAYYEDSTHILPVSNLLPARGVTKPSSKRPSVPGDRTPRRVENGSPGELVHSMENSDQEGEREGEQERDMRFRSGSQLFKVKEQTILPAIRVSFRGVGRAFAPPWKSSNVCRGGHLPPFWKALAPLGNGVTLFCPLPLAIFSK